MVDSRCATITVVRPPEPFLEAEEPPPLRRRASESWTTRCDAASSAAVASSRNRIFGSLTIALAMAMRWRCPPDSCPPRSPTSVPKPCGSASTNAAAPAATAAALTSASVAEGLPNRMLSATEHENSVGSWGTSAVAALKDRGSSCRRSTPSSAMEPRVGS